MSYLVPGLGIYTGRFSTETDPLDAAIRNAAYEMGLRPYIQVSGRFVRHGGEAIKIEIDTHDVYGARPGLDLLDEVGS